jgi:hypothetical protein
MAIRRPSISSPEWLFQDFSYSEDPAGNSRYIQVKWDGKPFTRVSQSFDFSDPPFVGSEQRGGSIVAQLDYTVEEKLITIDQWSVNWRDELPLRLAINYLSNCLYSYGKGWVIRVLKDTEAYAFFVSEYFYPFTNEVGPETYLYFSAESRDRIL